MYAIRNSRKPIFLRFCISCALLVCLIPIVVAQEFPAKLDETTSAFQSPEALLAKWNSLERNGEQSLLDHPPEYWLTDLESFEQGSILSSNDSLLLQLNYVHGVLLFYMSRYKQAIPYLKSALDRREELTQNQLKAVLVNLEESYRRTANLKEAIPLRKERIELGYDNDFFEIYEEAGLYSEAIIEYTQHNNFPKDPLGRLGYHARLGRLFNQNNQLDSAIHHYERAFASGFETLDSDDYLGKRPQYEFRKKFWTYEMQGEIGAIYVKQGRFEEAIPFLKKIIEVAKEINESALVVPKRLSLAECYLNLGEIALAKKHLDTVRQVISEMDWFVHDVKLKEVLSAYFFKTGVYDSAAIVLKESNRLKDSIQSVRNENKLIATTAFLDNERQGKLLAEQRLALVAFENERIEKSNQITILIFVISGSLGLAFFLYVDTRRKQKAKEKALFDKEVIEQQSARIKELDQVKTRFFSNISHEFRTPLTLIQGPVESVLQGRVKGEALIKKNLEVANRNIDNLSNLIDEILEFNKMDLGALDIHYVPVLLADYLRSFTDNYELLIQEKDLRCSLESDIDSSLRLDLPIVKIDRIINNLLSNAIKHSPKGGIVRLTVNYDGSTLIIKVIDNGLGIPKGEQEKIFERFYQASEGKLMPHSSGIGLAYVKEITEALGGTISVESSIELGGSSFIFTLPAEPSGQATAVVEKVEEEEFEEQLAYEYPNNKILITEDNEEMANYIRQVLGDEFVIDWAENGKEALKKLESFDADLIISDIMMPGLQLLEALKSDETYKYKSVIMLTAKSSQETRLDALSFGLDDYLTKPFNPLELEYRVKNLLSNQYERAQWLKKEGSDDDSQVEDPMIKWLISEIERNLDNRHYGVLDLADSAAMSDRQLTRVIKKAIGMTPANLIKEVKLQKAKEFFESKKYRSIAEVCYAVGFEKPGYFSEVYYKRFGKKPADYLVKG